MYAPYIYASYAVTFILLGGLTLPSLRGLAAARRLNAKSTRSPVTQDASHNEHD